MCKKHLPVQGIELDSSHFKETTVDYLAKVKRITAENDLSLASVAVSNDFGHQQKLANERELIKVKEWLDIAKMLGSPILRVFAGWPKDDKERQWDEMIQYLRKCTEYAEDNGIVLGLENHNHGGFIQTSKDVKRVFNEIESNWLGLTLDTGNFLNGIESIKKSVSYAVHVHAKFLNLDKSGKEKNINYDRIIHILGKNKYEGFISMEYEGEEEELTAVPRGVSYLKDLLEKVRSEKDTSSCTRS